VPQYVIEFGADQLQSIADALSRCMEPPLDISLDAPGAEMHYVAAGDLLAGVLAALETGTATSAVVRNLDERIRYGLTTNPRFNRSDLSLWMGTIEIGIEQWEPVWEMLVKESHLRFVCVGREEGVELRDEQIHADTFPWTEWPC
jgi:hypothetical protein